MTGCGTCGATVALEDQSGGTTEGSFTEVYECARGHRGRISGEASDPPTAWNRTGQVFNDY